MALQQPYQMLHVVRSPRQPRIYCAEILHPFLEQVVSPNYWKGHAHELNERQKLLDKLQHERSILEGTTSRDMVTYDPNRFSVWVRTLKNNFLSMDFETRREFVRKFIARIEVRPDRSAEMTWNPDAILQLADGARIPETAIMVMKERCGGMKQIDRHYPCPKIRLEFHVKGKSRWPFGWEILRELANARASPSM